MGSLVLSKGSKICWANPGGVFVIFKKLMFNELDKFDFGATISATSDSDSAPCVEPKLSSADSDEILLYQTKTTVPN